MRFCAVRVDLRIPALPSQIWSADCEPIGQCDQMTCCPIFASSTFTQQGTSPCITDPLDMPFLFELSTMGVLQDLVSWWTWFSQKQFVGVPLITTRCEMMSCRRQVRPVWVLHLSTAENRRRGDLSAEAGCRHIRSAW